MRNDVNSAFIRVGPSFGVGIGPGRRIKGRRVLQVILSQWHMLARAAAMVCDPRTWALATERADTAASCSQPYLIIAGERWRGKREKKNLQHRSGEKGWKRKDGRRGRVRQEEGEGINTRSRCSYLFHRVAAALRLDTSQELRLGYRWNVRWIGSITSMI